MLANLRKLAGNFAGALASQFSEGPATTPAPAPDRFPGQSRNWLVEFEIVGANGQAERHCLHIECAQPMNRKEAARAVRKSVHQKIARFVEFIPAP